MANYALQYVSLSQGPRTLAEFGEDRERAIDWLKARQMGMSKLMKARYMIYDADDPERGYLDSTGLFPGEIDD